VLHSGLTDQMFITEFCQEMLGASDYGLDFQCKVKTGYSESVACGVSRQLLPAYYV